MDTSYITDSGCYYCGILFFPSTASYFFKTGRLLATAYAANFQGISPQSYKNTFEVFLYDDNNRIIAILCYHSIKTECNTTCKMVFSTLEHIEIFYVEALVTILYT